jgi:hypothetical protein
VPGGLAAEHAAAFDQRAVHEAVADRGALEGNAALAERMLERVVAHQRADHRAAQAAAVAPVLREQPDQRVAVEQAAVAVHHQHAVAVAVEGDAEVRAGRRTCATIASGCIEPTPRLMFRPSGARRSR